MYHASKYGMLPPPLSHGVVQALDVETHVQATTEPLLVETALHVLPSASATALANPHADFEILCTTADTSLAAACQQHEVTCMTQRADACLNSATFQETSASSSAVCVHRVSAPMSSSTSVEIVASPRSSSTTVDVTANPIRL